MPSRLVSCLFANNYIANIETGQIYLHCNASGEVYRPVLLHNTPQCDTIEMARRIVRLDALVYELYGLTEVASKC